MSQKAGKSTQYEAVVITGLAMTANCRQVRVVALLSSETDHLSMLSKAQNRLTSTKRPFDFVKLVP